MQVCSLSECDSYQHGNFPLLVFYLIWFNQISALRTRLLCTSQMASRTCFPLPRGPTWLTGCILFHTLLCPLSPTSPSDWVWDWDSTKGPLSSKTIEPSISSNVSFVPGGSCFPKTKYLSTSPSTQPPSLEPTLSFELRRPNGSDFSDPQGMIQMGQSGGLMHNSTELRASKLLTTCQEIHELGFCCFPRKSKAQNSSSDV